METGGIGNRINECWPGRVLARTAELRARGLHDKTLSRGVQRGLLLRLHHGVYLRTADWRSAKPWDQELLRIQSHYLSTDGASLYSHVTAARLHRCWIWHADSKIHVTIPYRSASGNFGRNVAAHHRVLPVDRTALLRTATDEPIRVCSLAQTVVDCARIMSFEGAVVLADSAFRQGVERHTVERILTESELARGAAKVARVLAAVDARSESAGETRTRLLFGEWRLEMPESQLEIPTPAGVFRADFAWPALRLILEFDGKSKYFEFGPTAEAIYQERRRERALLEQGWQIIRIEWKDLDRPIELKHRIHAALERAKQSRAQG